MIVRLLKIIEELTKKYEKYGDIEVLKTNRAPQIREIKVRVSKIKPYDNYLLID